MAPTSTGLRMGAGIAAAAVSLGVAQLLAVFFSPAADARTAVGTAVINLILSIIFIKMFGLVGAALATLVGYFISFLLMQRRLNIDFSINWMAPIRYAFGFYAQGWQFFLKKMNLMQAQG